MNLDSAVFYSHDIEAVKKFYSEIIGLKIEYQTGDKFISFIFPNGARLGIKKAKEERECPGKQTVFISIENVEALFEKLNNLQVKILKPLTDEPWAKEFSVLDPDNNKVQFMQRK